MSDFSFRNLGEFLDQLRRDDDLTVIESRVDARLEVAEIHRRVIAAGGPALLFTNVKNSKFPLVTNLFGTARRAQMAFGREPFDLVRNIVRLVESELPPRPATLWQNRSLLARLARLGTRGVRRAPVLSHQGPPRLDEMPILTCWPEDGGPFITLPLVYTEHPDGRGHNLGMYRLQVYDSGTTGMHWQIGKGGGFHYAEAESRKEALPVTVFLGGPPPLILSAIAPLPENVPELVLTSFLMGRKLRQSRGVDPHPIPAEAEFALVGRVPPERRRLEGPFGDHYGYYSLEHEFPVFEIDRVYHRDDPVYPATVVGKPRQEDFFIGDLLQELLSPVFPLVMPSVEDLWSYGETGYHSLAAARVKERYRREAMAAGFRILGEGQLSLTKFLLVTDRPVDLKDFRKFLPHLLRRTNPETDLYVLSNLSMDTLDYTGPRLNEGSKGVWLGLGDPVRELPVEFRSPDVDRRIREVLPYCPGCLVVEADSYEVDPKAAQEIAKSDAFRSWPLIVVTDEAKRAVASTANFLWTTFTRFEPAADIHAAKTRIVRHHLSYEFPIVIDARVKPGFPEELTCSPEIARQVTERWKEYFPEGQEMGDSETGHLTAPD